MEFFEHALMDGYAGMAGAVVAMGLGVSQFARRRWPGLLVWVGVAFGVAVAQGATLSGLAGGVDAFGLLVNGVLGGVFGMVAGGIAADAWQERVTRGPDWN